MNMLKCFAFWVKTLYYSATALRSFDHFALPRMNSNKKFYHFHLFIFHYANHDDWIGAKSVAMGAVELRLIWLPLFIRWNLKHIQFEYDDKSSWSNWTFRALANATTEYELVPHFMHDPCHLTSHHTQPHTHTINIVAHLHCERIY